jgi:acyl carrier protein
MNNVVERVNQIISRQLEIDSDKLSGDASIFEDLGADSIDSVELIIAFEVEFDIEIPESDAEKLFTLKNVYDYIKSRLEND